MKRREVIASMRVSRFSRALSRVRRMSAGAKRLKTSSEDSGNSQNCCEGRLSVQSPRQEDEQRVHLQKSSTDRQQECCAHHRA